jgi:hypothetical protein
VRPQEWWRGIIAAYEDAVLDDNDLHMAWRVIIACIEVEAA